MRDNMIGNSRLCGYANSSAPNAVSMLIEKACSLTFPRTRIVGLRWLALGAP
jgi:hypothetical protein